MTYIDMQLHRKNKASSCKLVASKDGEGASMDQAASKWPLPTKGRIREVLRWVNRRVCKDFNVHSATINCRDNISGNIASCMAHGETVGWRKRIDLGNSNRFERAKTYSRAQKGMQKPQGN